jgi:hypothetical protein
VNSVLVGFGALLAVGWVAGRVRVLGDGAAEVLSRPEWSVTVRVYKPAVELELVSRVSGCSIRRGR